MSNNSQNESAVLKEIGGKRYPIPTNAAERFMATVWSIAGMSGVDKVPGILKRIEDLNEAVTEHLAGSSTSNSSLASQKKRFIAVFKSRYLEYTGHDFPSAMSGADMRVLGHAVKKINDSGFVVDTFIEWLFEEYMPQSRTFNPASFSMVTSNTTVAKFLIDRKGCVDPNMRLLKVKEKQAELRDRLRYLYSESTDVPVEVIESLKGDARDYAKYKIDIETLERKIAEVEKKYLKGGKNDE